MERTVEIARQCVNEQKDGQIKISPKLGAVIARDGEKLGEAYRGQQHPGDHAEFTLLEKNLKGVSVMGATLYTTLEPCTTGRDAAKGKRPCAEWIIDHQIARVVIGVLDPNNAICGRGLRRLMGAGIQVVLLISTSVRRSKNSTTSSREIR
ncbi:deaminase [Mycobacterium deserti]|uniref:Deaminase n=1 Tax=Mycobacterium deserti TaxID=2978347 RepID=A0ABT2MFF2_9MYCO|nr:deaminase [Mycobacterium deserti]MCT7661011.1 deaminase [Mycobacterium deserti]